MSYQEKYLKYKSKYLALKSQANNKTNNINLSNLVQLGGSKSIYGNELLIDHIAEQLTATPTLTEIWNGVYKNNTKDINNLTRLLSESEKIVTTEFSLDGGSEPNDDGSSDNSSNASSESSAVQTEESNSNQNEESNASQSEQTATVSDQSNSVQSESDQSNQSKSESDQSTKSDSVPSDTESDQVGGKKKPDSYTKFFFEDSDILGSSTTSDSELSSFDTSSTDDSLV